jgi:hypothetical protein
MAQVLSDAKHLVRLALLFLAGFLLFLVIRAFFVPPGFGEFGHFRTGTLQDVRNNTPLHFGGRASCGEADCHEEVTAALATDSHARVGCESCHGALAAHAVDPKIAKTATIDELDLCSRCHALNPARPEGYTQQVDIEVHREESACSECHDAHEPSS